MLYPAPFRDALLQNASPEVDPRFVLSIARQESRFQADAKSVAAARGMMQFIASTANEIATLSAGRSVQPRHLDSFRHAVSRQSVQAVSEPTAGGGRFVQGRR